MAGLNGVIKGTIKGDSKGIIFLHDSAQTAEILFDGDTLIIDRPITSGGLTKLPDGTAAAPSLEFTNSTGVGLFRSSSNVLGIATAGTERVQIDAQGDVNILGGRGIEGGTTGVGTYWVQFIPLAAQQAISGPGAVTLTEYYTAMTATGAADAMTLANGKVIGQLKKIRHIAGVNTMVLTPATPSGFATVTFPATFVEFVILGWNGSAWILIENSGCTIA